MDEGKQSVQPPRPSVLGEMLSVLFPVHCVHCGNGGNWLCPGCAAGLKLAGQPYRCIRGQGSGPSMAGAAFSFAGPARSLVHRLKYGGQRRLAGFMADISLPAAAGFVADCAAAGNLTEKGGRVNLTYVPQHSSKQVSRGYNQAAMYARALARRLGAPVADLLSKHHPTTPQNRLDFDQRRNNLVGSFSLRRGICQPGDAIILVDDVYTTGATAGECSRILNEGLGVEVYIWTFARTVKRSSR